MMELVQDIISVLALMSSSRFPGFIMLLRVSNKWFIEKINIKQPVSKSTHHGTHSAGLLALTLFHTDTLLVDHLVFVLN